mgnify:FL=1
MGIGVAMGPDAKPGGGINLGIETHPPPAGKYKRRKARGVSAGTFLIGAEKRNLERTRKSVTLS